MAQAPRSLIAEAVDRAQANRGGDRNGGCGRYRGGKGYVERSEDSCRTTDLRERHGVRAVGRWATHRPVDSRRPGQRGSRGQFRSDAGMQFKALIEAGFTVWQVTRRRNMPTGHSVADMADDYAQLIADQFGGRVEVVVGISYGGMIAQYLAANHPRRMARVVLALAAARVSDWGQRRRRAVGDGAGRGAHG